MSLAQDQLQAWLTQERAKVDRIHEEQKLFLERKRTVTDAIDRSRQSDREADARARIYFIQENVSDAIKVGTSRCIRARVSALRVSTPGALTVLAATEGGRCVEGLLHWLFAHIRIRGEWFRPAPELLEYIASLESK